MDASLLPSTSTGRAQPAPACRLRCHAGVGQLRARQAPRRIVAAEAAVSPYGPRQAGHPAAFADDPAFVAFPSLNSRPPASLIAVPEHQKALGKSSSGTQHHGSGRWRMHASHAETLFADSSKSLLHRFGKALAMSSAVDVKEVLEAAEMYERVKRRVRRRTVVDVACGHGLLGVLFAVLERGVERVVLIDRSRPKSFDAVMAAAAEVAPWAPAKVTYLETDVWELHACMMTGHAPAAGGAQHSSGSSGSSSATGAASLLRSLSSTEHAAPQAAAASAGGTAAGAAAPTPAAALNPAAAGGARPPLAPGAGFVAIHACGALTDAVLDIAAAAGGPCAVMPCCYTGTATTTGPARQRRTGGKGKAGQSQRQEGEEQPQPLPPQQQGTPGPPAPSHGGGWAVPLGVRRALGVALAADVDRSYRMALRWGYEVDWSAVPRSITPMNRILVATPRVGPGTGAGG